MVLVLVLAVEVGEVFLFVPKNKAAASAEMPALLLQPLGSLGEGAIGLPPRAT